MPLMGLSAGLSAHALRGLGQGVQGLGPAAGLHGLSGLGQGVHGLVGADHGGLQPWQLQLLGAQAGLARNFAGGLPPGLPVMVGGGVYAPGAPPLSTVGFAPGARAPRRIVAGAAVLPSAAVAGALPRKPGGGGRARAAAVAASGLTETKRLVDDSQLLMNFFSKAGEDVKASEPREAAAPLAPRARGSPVSGGRKRALDGAAASDAADAF